MTTSPSTETARRTRENERPLVEDIRLLGRILGDVIRDQDGDAAFDLVEQVRKLSVAFRRHADHDADHALKNLLSGLSGDQTVSVIRAFTYFSHLANLAEDRHHIRRRAVHERAGETHEGSIDVALSRPALGRHRAGRTGRQARRQLCIAGADRAPDRSAAQEHSGCGAGYRAVAGCAR